MQMPSNSELVHDQVIMHVMFVFQKNTGSSCILEMEIARCRTAYLPTPSNVTSKIQNIIFINKSADNIEKRKDRLVTELEI